MQNNIEKTEKNNKKLVLQISLNGYSFCVINLLNQQISNLTETTFKTTPKTNKNNHITKIVSENLISKPELNEQYDEIIVLYSNNLNTFVPDTLFDEDYLGSYLQYNTKVFETDFFAFDTIENFEMHNVFIPYIHINNILIDHFKNFKYKHSNSILVPKILNLSKNNDSKKMYVHVQKNHFEIIVAHNQKLILFNSFEYKTPEDFIYYILFTAEQLDLNPDNVSLELLGDISQNDDFYKIAYKYIRNISFLHVNFLRVNNYFSEAENLKHFILFSA
jgi:Protein of unknown function (DUF3822)